MRPTGRPPSRTHRGNSRSSSGPFDGIAVADDVVDAHVPALLRNGDGCSIRSGARKQRWHSPRTDEHSARRPPRSMDRRISLRDRARAGSGPRCCGAQVGFMRRGCIRDEAAEPISGRSSAAQVDAGPVASEPPGRAAEVERAVVGVRKPGPASNRRLRKDGSSFGTQHPRVHRGNRLQQPLASTTTASRRAHFGAQHDEEGQWGRDEDVFAVPRRPGALRIAAGLSLAAYAGASAAYSGGGHDIERGSGNRGAGALDPQRPDPAAPGHA